MDPLLDFSDKVVLISGAASGFGKGLAKALAQRGAKLVLGDIDGAGLDAVASCLREQKCDVTSQLCDVAKEEDCKALVDAAIKQFGRLDMAVNNAGVSQDFVSIEDTDNAIIDQQLNVNVKGVLYALKHQIPVMRQQGGGAILNVSSMAGLGGSPKLGAYTAAKHAVIGLTKTAAVENGRYGIRVNAICPFFTLTPMVLESDMAKAKGIDQMKAFLARGAPMKRLGEPEEIVSAMVLMLSPLNTYMTGQAIAVDGGVSAL
jgi:hypothetical protein